MLQWPLLGLALTTAALIRAILLLPALAQKRYPKRQRAQDETCSIGIFLGSGGHTAEMIQLVRALDARRYTPRTYIHCTGDAMSVELAERLEATRRAADQEDRPREYTFLELPRARRVAQPMLSSAISSAQTLVVAVWQLVIVPAGARQHSRDFKTGRDGVPFDALLLNGPGTCVIVVLACYIAKFLGRPAPTIIYVESFARVSTLSLSGKILQHLVDRFIVQWEPAASGKGGKREYHGWLI